MFNPSLILVVGIIFGIGIAWIFSAAADENMPD